MRKKVHYCLTAMLLLLSACNKQATTEAAPLGQKQPLEILADSYRKIAKQYPIAPLTLKAQAKREFVERVFIDAGYSYSNTLQALSRVKPEGVTQYHRDMKQLLFLPHTGLSENAIKDIFNDQEQQAIKEIGTKNM